MTRECSTCGQWLFKEEPDLLWHERALLLMKVKMYCHYARRQLTDKEWQAVWCKFYAEN